jgi:1,4-dihydroxy-2-naphthoate polyprenyltransferase
VIVAETTERAETTKQPTEHQNLPANWRTVMQTCNPPKGHVDVVSRWLVLTRACVQPMTLTAAAIAGLLAVHTPGADWLLFALASIGIVLAHASNNLMNDLFDLDIGSDTREYPRALYAPHPVLSGMITRQGLLRAAAVVNLIDLGILIALVILRDAWVLAFALSGFIISVEYAAPPLRLKKHGLGEPSVLLVWGPLMVGGVYYATVGHLPWHIVADTIPYALLCTAVLMGKHLDKLEWDAPAGVGTLPVRLGERRAREVTLGLMVGFYVSVIVLAATGALSAWALVSLIGVTRLVPVWKVFSQPKPDGPPPEYPDYPIWPLWFTAAAFVHARRAGALFVAGLILAAILPG